MNRSRIEMDEVLEGIVLRPFLSSSPGYLNAAMPAEAEGESLDGSIRWYYGPDDDGNLIIRLSSYSLEYENRLVLAYSGEWSCEMQLEQVEPGQLGADLVIAACEVAGRAFEQGIYFRLAD